MLVVRINAYCFKIATIEYGFRILKFRETFWKRNIRKIDATTKCPCQYLLYSFRNFDSFD